MTDYFVYILKCSDNTYYTGYTIDLEKRLKKHNDGKASKYTRVRLPVTMVYSHKAISKSDALKKEILIKKQNRIVKEKLIENKINIDILFNN